MTDPISQLGRASVQMNPNADQVKNKKADAADANKVAPKPQQDEVGQRDLCSLTQYNLVLLRLNRSRTRLY